MPFNHRLIRLLGIEVTPAGHREKIASAVGGLLGIALILLVSRLLLGAEAALPVVASMGASAVLLFAVPSGPLSQPWPLLGGHAVAALVGVSCQLLLGPSLLSAALAVALAIVAMYYLQCIHPPGGATALVAVIGGPAVYGLGYWFVLTPVLLNAVSILAVALLFNNLVPWRTYPARPLPNGNQRKSAIALPAGADITRGDLKQALAELEIYVDISEAELEQILRRAGEIAGRRGQR